MDWESDIQDEFLKCLLTEEERVSHGDVNFEDHSFNDVDLKYNFIFIFIIF